MTEPANWACVACDHRRQSHTNRPTYVACWCGCPGYEPINLDPDGTIPDDDAAWLREHGWLT